MHEHDPRRTRPKPDGDTRNEGVTEVTHSLPDEYRDLGGEST